MAAPNINTYANDYVFGRGRLLFNPLVAGVYQGFRPFGNCPGFTLGAESTKFEHFSSESGLGEKDLDITTRINRTCEITSDNLTAGNFALFLAGTESTLTQAATPITDEVVGPVIANRTYQLGATTSNPSGVRNVGSVVVRIKEGDDAASRANSTAYVAGNVYQPATPNLHWYICTIAGTSAGSPPTFTTDGTTFADGTATFKDMGLIIVASTANVNYRVDTTFAFLSITPAGTIATANTAYAAVVSGGLLSLNVDYTPVAGTRSQIATGDATDLSGQLKFIADNPNGTNRDAFFPDVTLGPNGTIPLITEDELASMAFSVGINKLDSTTAAVYIDGRPVNT